MLQKIINFFTSKEYKTGYEAFAYLDEGFKHLMCSIKSDDFDEIKEFIWEACQKGLNCKFYDYESRYYEGGIALARHFDETTTDVEELITYYSYM